MWLRRGCNSTGPANQTRGEGKSAAPPIVEGPTGWIIFCRAVKILSTSLPSYRGQRPGESKLSLDITQYRLMIGVQLQ